MQIIFEKNKSYLGDCLDLMPQMETGMFDAIICDLPFGITGCKWDAVIPFEPLWKEYERLIKPNGNIILFASQPFTSALVMSNPKSFRYEVIWQKDKPSNFAFAKHGVMKYHESILIFGKGETYNPQMILGKPNHSVGKGIRKKNNESGANTKVVSNKLDGWKHPKSVIQFNREPNPIHPTQKSIDVMKWVVLTYTNENDLILDNCAGSGTTGIACLTTGRNYIQIEKEQKYFDLILGREKVLIKKGSEGLLLPLKAHTALQQSVVSRSVCSYCKQEKIESDELLCRDCDNYFHNASKHFC